MTIWLIKRTKNKPFYLYIRFTRGFWHIGFYYKGGDEVLFPLNPKYWFKRQFFLSISFETWFRSLKDLDKTWKKYEESFRKRSLNLYSNEENNITEGHIKRIVKNIHTNVKPVVPPPSPQRKEEKE